MEPMPVGSVDELDSEELSPPLVVPTHPVLPDEEPYPPEDEEDPYAPDELSMPVVRGLSVVLEGSMPVGEVSVMVSGGEVVGPDVETPVDDSPLVPLAVTTLSQPVSIISGRTSQTVRMLGFLHERRTRGALVR